MLIKGIALLITCIVTLVWLSSGLPFFNLMNLAIMLKFNLLDWMVKLESKDLLLVWVWHSIELFL
jgi:hypothetical protein